MGVIGFRALLCLMAPQPTSRTYAGYYGTAVAKPAISSLFASAIKSLCSEFQKRWRKSPAFSGANLKYSQISETDSGEWFDIRLGRRPSSIAKPRTKRHRFSK